MQVLLRVNCMERKRAASPIFCKNCQSEQCRNYKHKVFRFLHASDSVFFAYAVFPHRSTGRASRIFLYYNRLGREYAAVNKQKPPFLVFFMKPVRLDVADHVRTVIGPISDKTAALLIKNRQNAAAFRKTPPIFLFNLS